MYYCTECEHTFDEPHEYFETHGFKNGPFERWSVCPFCGEPGYVMVADVELETEEDE